MTGQLRGAGRATAIALALLTVGPLLVLPVRALADVWRAPALLPQRWGTRGLEVVLAPGTGTATAITNSLLVAVVTTVLAVVLAWPAARWLSTASARRRTPVLVVLALPLLVPPLAIGAGLAEWFLRLGLTRTLAGLVLAHLVAVLPYVVVVLAPGFTPAGAPRRGGSPHVGSRALAGAPTGLAADARTEPRRGEPARCARQLEPVRLVARCRPRRPDAAARARTVLGSRPTGGRDPVAGLPRPGAGGTGCGDPADQPVRLSR